MFYSVSIATAANTAEADAVETPVGVVPGLTQHVWVGFPKGCVGLVYAQIYHVTRQVWPTTPGASFNWDDFVFDFDDRYPLVTEPFEFVVKTWNLDDSYRHTVLFAVTVEAAPSPWELGDLEAVWRDLGIWQPEEG